LDFTGNTPPVVQTNVDLLALAALLLGEPSPFNGTLPGGIGSYNLATLNLKTGIDLAQDLEFQPTSVMETITPNGDASMAQTGTLGSMFSFVVPASQSTPFTLAPSYSITGNLVDSLGVLGQVVLNLKALSASIGGFSLGPVINTSTSPFTGPPVYLYQTDPFALGGFIHERPVPESPLPEYQTIEG